MANTRSKSSSNKTDANVENECPMISITVVKELLKVQESTMKSFFAAFMEANDKRLERVLCDLQDLKSSSEFTQNQVQDLLKLRVKEEINKIQGDLESIREKADDLENRSRRNNLCFDGVNESMSENWTQTEEKVMKVLHDNLDLDAENIEIERAHRIGQKKDGKSRSIVAKFLSYKDREKVFKSKRKLKGTGIFIREDLSERVQNKRKELQPKLHEARQDGKIAYFRYDKLVVHDRSPVIGTESYRGFGRGRGRGQMQGIWLDPSRTFQDDQYNEQASEHKQD